MFAEYRKQCRTQGILFQRKLVDVFRISESPCTFFPLNLLRLAAWFFVTLHLGFCVHKIAATIQTTVEDMAFSL